MFHVPCSMRRTIVISLGGSIVAPAPGKIDVEFLKDFKRFVLGYLKKRWRFVIVVGGGEVCRCYQKAAAKIKRVSQEELDWLGIQATKLNAWLLKAIFGEIAVILRSPYQKIEPSEKLFIAAGWKPGCSTDYDTVLLAKRFKAGFFVEATNIDYVYEKDPRCFPRAKPLPKLSWQEYKKVIPQKWQAGMKTPIDPMAAKLAEKVGLKVVILKGTDFKNFKNFLEGRKFKGTIIGNV